MCSLHDVGEFGLISKIRNNVAGLLPKGLVGIGDDCAVIPLNEHKSLLVSTDALIENTHFLLNKISAKALAYKAVTVNLSDIAAMGGIPKYLFLSVGLPKKLDMRWIDEFLANIYKATEQYKVNLLGGDTTRSDSGLFLNATIIGEAEPNKIKYRSTATVGDIVCVTGDLGDSAAGLQSVLQDIPSDFLIEQHFYPRAQIEEGLFLASFSAVHAMMDISDGLNSDIARILEMSSCGAKINIDNLPVSKEMRDFAVQHKKDPFEIAVLGGEDYCLLVTIAENSFVKIAKEFEGKFNRPLTQVGRITEPANGLKYCRGGKECCFRDSGFKHF